MDSTNIIFLRLCAEIKKTISECEMPFICGKIDEKHMWISDNQKCIGGIACHYEILFHDDKKPNYVTVDIHFETKHQIPLKEIEKILQGFTKADDADVEFYQWFRRKDKTFPVSTAEENIANILEELYALNNKYGKKICELIHGKN